MDGHDVQAGVVRHKLGREFLDHLSRYGERLGDLRELTDGVELDDLNHVSGSVYTAVIFESFKLLDVGAVRVVTDNNDDDAHGVV